MNLELVHGRGYRHLGALVLWLPSIPKPTVSGRVYRLYSTLELSLEDVMGYFGNDPELLPEVEDAGITRRNNAFVIKAVSADNNLSKYTPTAQLKVSVTENRVYEEGPPRVGVPNWGDEEEGEIPSELVEFACFKGDLEAVFQSTAFQYPVSPIPHEIAIFLKKGTLTAITRESDELQATHIVGGEVRAASIEVVGNPQQNGSLGGGISWHDDKFVS